MGSLCYREKALVAIRWERLCFSCFSESPLAMLILGRDALYPLLSTITISRYDVNRKVELALP